MSACCSKAVVPPGVPGRPSVATSGPELFYGAHLPYAPAMKQATFTVRVGKDADWAALAQAIAEIQDFEYDIVGHPLMPGRDARERYLSDLRRRLSDDDGFFLVAEANGRIVGLLVGYVHEAGDRLVASEFDRSAYISDLYVQGERRRQGIATALVREFERTMLACLSGCHPYPLHLGCSQSPE